MADALLIIDLQNGVCHGEQPVTNLEQLIVGVNTRSKIYRNNKRPVIFVRHTDEDLIKDNQQWQVIPELDTQSSDYFVQKTHANSFYHTELKDLLNKLEVKSLEICGAQVEYCIDTTIKMAHGLGYELSMVKGLATTVDNEFLTGQQMIDFYSNKIWNHRFLEFIGLNSN